MQCFSEKSKKNSKKKAKEDMYKPQRLSNVNMIKNTDNKTVKDKHKGTEN